MKIPLISLLAFSATIGCAVLSAGADLTSKALLTDGWSLQSATQVPNSGEVISTTAFKSTDWHSATVPSTICGALVDDKTYPDPFFGMNLKDLSTNNAFKGPWW